jgi:hypothetical protein
MQIKDDSLENDLAGSDEEVKKLKPMTESQVKAILDAHIRNSMGYIGGELSDQRSRAMDYYLSEPFGDEAEGRSKVVSSDVMDTIEWIMPSMMRTFTATDDAVRFDAQNEDDTKAAEQETDYVNHVFYKENKGFLVLYTWIKDALLQKNGIVKSFWEESKEETREEYVNLTDDQFMSLMQDEELKAIEYAENPQTQIDPQTGKPVLFTTHDVVFKRTKIKGQAKIINIAPEDFFISKGHPSIDIKDVPFCAHRAKKTASELLEMGVSQDVIDKLPSSQEVDSEEKIKRNQLDDEFTDFNQESADKSVREITIYECYIRMDYDGDGIAELRKITKAGEQIIDKEGPGGVEVDAIPFTAITPVILCHKFFGLSVADLVMDLQKIKSTIWRQMLDNMYLSNNGRNAINKNLVNIDDLLTSRPGGIVRVDGDPSTAIVPLVTQPLNPTSYQMIEYIDRVREGRTGVSQAAMGLNDNLLNNNKGDPTVARVMTAAEQRVELIARIFAETGIKSLFLRLHELLMKHQDQEKIVQLRNEWIPIRPQEWRTRTDMTVNVALGNGERQQAMQSMMMILNMYKDIIASGGLDVLVTLPNIYRAAIDTVKLSGIKNPSVYFTDPTSDEAKQVLDSKAKQAEEAKVNDPNLLFVKVEAEKVALQHQREIFNMQQNQAKEIEKLRQDYESKVNDQAIKLTELELKYSQPPKQNIDIPGSLV